MILNQLEEVFEAQDLIDINIKNEILVLEIFMHSKYGIENYFNEMKNKKVKIPDEK